MAVRQVLRMGHPLLLQRALPVVEFNTAALDILIQDMFDTMAELNGAGLAAPQIAEGFRVVIFSIDNNPRYPDAERVPSTILINPEIEILSSEEQLGWEGCLSVPGMRGQVPRHQHIRYRGFDAAGNLFEREVSGIHARVVQHECDHLDGVLYPQRIRDMSEFGFTDVLTEQGRVKKVAKA